MEDELKLASEVALPPSPKEGNNKAPNVQLILDMAKLNIDNEQDNKMELNTDKVTTPKIKPSPIIRQGSLPSKNEFDYPKFLDHIRQPEAISIVKYLEKFVKEFDKRTHSFKQLLKIMHEFMDFILIKMLDNPVFYTLIKSNDPEEEYQFETRQGLIDYLQEGIEQYLMNRLHNFCFCPIGTEDNEMDHILSQRYKFFSWIKESHLDIVVTDHNQYYISFASQELQKINKFKTPRHKMICLLNCCKYLFALLKKMEKEHKGSMSGADSFLPLLIFTILKAKPNQLSSNLHYISRFRHPSKLLSEPGYYLTQFFSACSFIENIEPSALSITKEEFDKNLEETLKELDQDNNDSLPITPLSQEHPTSPIPTFLNSSSLNENNSIPGRSSPLSQRMRRPLDIMNKFINDVTNPLQIPSDSEDSPQSKNNLKKKKSFLLQLFGSSSSDSENESDEDIGNIRSPIKPSTTMRRNSTATVDEKLLAILPQNNNNSDVSPPISSPLPLPFDEGIAILIDMFPSYEPQVLGAVLEARNGDLTTCIENILNMEASPPPFIPKNLPQENSVNSSSEEKDLIDL